MSEQLITILMCHLIGDYVLQSDYVATNKGTDWYILFVHCVLYCVPFVVCFGFDWRIVYIFVTHVVIDAAKARYKMFGIIADQQLHYLILIAFLMSIGG